jgi:glyoxylase-like metal-dependent hydrolase (beta-lactamase superfamily II)
VENLPIHKMEIPTPYPVGDINVYLWEEEPLTLIDSGPPTREAKERLRSELSKLGFRFKDIRRVVLTHGHPDHIGLAPLIKKESLASIYMHGDDASLFKNLKDRGAILDICIQIGLDRSIADLVAQYYIEVGIPTLSVEADVQLRDGDLLTSSSGTNFEVIHCPGHSPGSIALYNSRLKCLISGDTLLRDISSNPLFSYEVKGNRGLKLYKSTLERLLDYDLDTVLPGHGGYLKGKEIRDRIIEILNHHRERERKILEIIGDREMTIFQISNELFGDLPISEIPLSIFEVSGHLKVLEEGGSIGVREEGRTLYYSAK